MCRTCDGKDCIQREETSRKLWNATCYWCVFKAGLEPTNRGPQGWLILGVKVSDGIYFAFEDVDGSIHPIHVTCLCNLADAKARLEILSHSRRWWLYTNKASKEYPTAEIFKQHYPNLFKVEETL